MKAGTLIKEIRLKRGVSQKILVKELGITQGYLSLVERGEKEPSLDLIKKIAKRLNVPQQLIVLSTCDTFPRNKKYIKPVKKIVSAINEILRSI